MANLSIYGKFNRQNPLRTFVSKKSKTKLPDRVSLEAAALSSLLDAIKDNAKTIDQLKEEIWNAGITPSDRLCTINSMADTNQLWGHPGEPFKIFFVKASSRKEAIQIENEILKYQRSLSERQRFAIIDLTEDEQNSVLDFNYSINEYDKYKKDVATIYATKAFDEAEDADRRKKQDLSYGWARLFLSASFWLTLGCLLLGACALTYYFDPLALVQGTNGAIIWDIALSFNIWMGSFIFGGLMVYSIWKDYQEFRVRTHTQRMTRTSHSYFSDVLDRLRNWFVDHKLQAILIGIGLVGSIVVLALLLGLGIDFPPFDFIIRSIANTLDRGMDTAGKLLYAAQLFEILFVLAPLSLGFLAKNAIAVHEARVSNDEGKVSEIRLRIENTQQEVQVRNFDEQTWIPLDLRDAKSASGIELGPFTNVFFHSNTFVVEDGSRAAQLPISDCYRTQGTPIWK